MSRTPHQGILQRHTAPLTTSGSNPLRGLVGVLGAPQQQFPFSPEDVRSTETFTLQRLFEGKPDYIGFSIAATMKSANPSILAILPMTRTDAIEFVYEYFDFPQELAVETPQQAPPGYVEVQKSSRRSSLTSYALGATTKVQELRTSEGQFIFRGKLITVAIGFVQVAELLAMRVLLETPSLYAHRYVQAGQHPFDLARAGRMQDTYFDILRRRVNGFAELISLVKDEFSGQRIAPTHAIMSEGMRSLIMADPQKLEYYRIGNSAESNQMQLADAIGQTYAGLRLVVIRAYELGKKDLRIHPLERNAILGQHWRLGFSQLACDLTRYCDKWMSTSVFSMETDTEVIIDTQDALDWDGRFDPRDGRLHSWHYHLRDNIAMEANRTHVPAPNHEYDMFLYTAHGDDGQPTVNVASLWGQMETWALKDPTIERVAKTFSYAVRRVISQAELDNIQAGLDDIRELFEKDLTAQDLAFMQAAGTVNKYGVRSLPPAPADFANYQPAGYGSVAGYLTLADAAGQTSASYIDADLLNRAAAFKRSAIKLHKLMLAIYDYTHPALDPNYAPAAYLLAQSGVAPRSKSVELTGSLLNFLQNIVDNPKATLFVGNTGNIGNAVEVEEIDDAGPYAVLNEIFAAIGAAPLLVAAFGSDAKVVAFEAEFAKSKFARVYADYVVSEGSTRRRTRGAASQDVDEAVAFQDEEGTPFAQFFQREIVNKRPTSLERSAALLGNVANYVRSNTAPERITAQTLQALGSEAGQNLNELLGGAASEKTPTAFVASLDAVARLGSDAVGIASPVNPGSEINLDRISEIEATLLDGSGMNSNLLRTSIITGSSAAAVGGVRGLPREKAAPRGVGGSLGAGAGAFPGFARDAFTDIVGDEIVVNKNIQQRYAQFGALGDWLLRVSAQMFILAPITKHTLQSFKRYNIVLPVEWLVEQFNRRYRTASIIFLRQPQDEPVGRIRYMDPDTHVGRNAINKNLMFNVTMYMGATVGNPQNWMVAHDTAVIGYDGGENTRPFDQEHFRITELSQLDIDGPSLLFFMVPAGTLFGKQADKVPLEHDIRGMADPINYSGASVHRESQFAERPFFASALYYNSKLDLHKIRTPTAQDWFRFQRADNTYNTVTQQGLQKVVNPDTNNYDHVIMPQDPFKESVYAGCRELRESRLPRQYKDMNYAMRSIAV